ncbi:bifunctional PIG-L family deacetylase/class I SAM-dependent methyltransferase [Brevibacterium sp. 2SA]|uniref:bifunctional PIG-L family deacetylase/class I SAM-dependent methyltransferase n=1 Tax=Brevibacterium sp. 2SA TaxID=2502198 RepID=UPI0020181EA8|nr:bifunctional PIG-L family deacetylase/class I SAM-dependent methyltransferase [Brevibacterium sp. 2SA]
MFTHLETGTSEDAWIRAGVRDLPRLQECGGSVVVLLAHPDDEAIGCAALLRRLGETDAHVTVLLFTAGENSHPGSPTHTPDDLRTIRLDEFDAALSELNPTAASTLFDLGDGALAAHQETILAEVMTATADLPGPLTIVAPHHADGHSDHDAVGEVAREVGRLRAATVLEFPIWYWHWADPDDAAWRSWRFLPDPDGLDREALWAHYPSQMEDLSDAPGDEAILPPDVLAHFARGGDTFAVTRFAGEEQEPPEAAEAVAEAVANDARTAEAVFDRVHTERVDPWELRSSDYEIAKRAALLRALPGSRYSHILEIGSSTGALSRELADRADHVTAIDASARALATARGLYPDVANLDFTRMTIPDDWPAGRFDCVVLAETGYYLSREQLRRTLKRIEASTTADFTLVLCHWRGEITDWPLDAESVHEMCLAYWPDASLVHHSAAEYRLDVLTITAKERG